MRDVVAAVPTLTEYEREYCTPDTQESILRVRRLPNDVLLAVAQDVNSAEHAALWDELGRNTNPFWITGRCAEEAYDRGLIDERELDRITE